MNKTVITVVGIIAASCLIGLYIWSSHNRYYIMTSDRGIAYEVDRKTGESWMLYGDRKVSQRGGSENRQKEIKLPYEAVSKVTGNAGISYGVFSGKIYNGSDWIVTRIVVHVTAKEDNEVIRWSRDFSEPVTIKPLTTESFSMAVAGGEGVKETIWGIKEVFGYKE